MFSMKRSTEQHWPEFLLSAQATSHWVERPTSWKARCHDITISTVQVYLASDDGGRGDGENIKSNTEQKVFHESTSCGKSEHEQLWLLGFEESSCCQATRCRGTRSSLFVILSRFLFGTQHRISCLFWLFCKINPSGSGRAAHCEDCTPDLCRASEAELFRLSSSDFLKKKKKRKVEQFPLNFH